jgi:hypothetical protein
MPQRLCLVTWMRTTVVKNDCETRVLGNRVVSMSVCYCRCLVEGTSGEVSHGYSHQGCSF